MMLGVSGAVSGRVYSDAQRAGIALAYVELSASEVSRRAHAGLLLDTAGRPLEPFDAPASSVRTIAMRARRNGVGDERGALDLAAIGKLAVKLAAKARRMVDEASTPREVEQAARMMEQVERLRGQLAKSPPASAAGSTLAAEILRAARGGSSSGPVTQGSTPPPPAVEAEPEPQPVDDSPGAWMRAQLAPAPEVSRTGPSAPPPRPSGTGLGFGDETLQSRPNPTPRDRPLPEYKEPRASRSIPGGPDYSAGAYESGRRW